MKNSWKCTYKGFELDQEEEVVVILDQAVIKLDDIDDGLELKPFYNFL